MSSLQAKNTLVVIKREKLGGKSPRKVRREGKIPAVVYGHKEVISILVDAVEFFKKFKKIVKNEVISLNLEGNEIFVIIKQYQFDYIKDKMIHMDFYEVNENKTIKSFIPLSYVGNSKGVKEGGILSTHMRKLEVECLPQNLPYTIEVDISEVTKNHFLKVSDIHISDSIKILSKDQTIVSIEFS